MRSARPAPYYLCESTSVRANSLPLREVPDPDPSYLASRQLASPTVFLEWSDLAAAFIVVIASTVAASFVVGARESALVAHSFAARFGFRRGEPPEHADDLWMESVGQRRGDAERRLRSFVVVSVTAVLVQVLPLNGWVAGGLVLGAWVALDLAARAYEKVLVGMFSDGLDDVGSTRDEIKRLFQIAFEPTKTNPLRGRWRPLGVFAGASSIALALIGWMGLLSAFGAEVQDVPNALRDLLGTNAFGPLAAAGTATILLGRLPLSVARRTALARADSSSTYEILFLRSFQDDGLTMRVRGDSRGIVDRLTLKHRHGYEHLLVASARHLGPVVAVGRPGERIPPIGAFRRYFANDEWQSAVERLLRRAKFVIVSVGDTPSVGWEISKIRTLGILDRTIFVVPPIVHAARQRRFEILASHLGIPPTVVQPTERGTEYLGLAFEAMHALPLASAALDYASYYAALVHVGFRLFDDSDVGGPVPAAASRGAALTDAAPSRHGGSTTSTTRLPARTSDRTSRWGT
jgi:hypothetical protein